MSGIFGGIFFILLGAFLTWIALYFLSLCSFKYEVDSYG
jgi:hypothetical protein